MAFWPWATLEFANFLRGQLTLNIKLTSMYLTFFWPHRLLSPGRLDKPKLTFCLRPHEIPSNTIFLVVYIDVLVVHSVDDGLHQAIATELEVETVKAFTFKLWNISFFFFINFSPTNKTYVLWGLCFLSYARKNI